MTKIKITKVIPSYRDCGCIGCWCTPQGYIKFQSEDGRTGEYYFQTEHEGEEYESDIDGGRINFEEGMELELDLTGPVSWDDKKNFQ